MLRRGNRLAKSTAMSPPVYCGTWCAGSRASYCWGCAACSWAKPKVVRPSPHRSKQIEREDVAGRVTHIEFLNNGVKTWIADRRAGINETIRGVHPGCRIDLVQMTIRRSNVHEFGLRRRTKYE